MIPPGKLVMVPVVMLASVAAPLAGGSASAATLGCGEVVTTSVILANDLTDCSGDGLVVGADGVTVDLGGHTIDGTFADDSVGVRNDGYDGVTITNGTVQEFERGVSLTNGADNGRVRGLTVHFISSDGILVNRSSGDKIINNLSRDNFTGILVSDSVHILVAENTSQYNSESGISLAGSQGSRITGNDVSSNDYLVEPFFGGITLSNSHRNRIDGNESSVGSGYGIALFGSDRNVISKNLVGRITSDGNGLNGIAIYSGSDGNTVRGNTAADNGLDGIFIAAGATENLVKSDIANNNYDDGIGVEDPSTTITANTADDNGDLGIEAVPGVTDGGRNTASGNGNLAQCVNVVCS
jgi:parallel beta-helix repeat protein